MFLFTTPSSTATGPTATAAPVVDAIRQGAEQTGTSFEYLLNTARRESSLDPSAKAASSSATGLFQFIEQTWLGLVKTEGPKLGLSDMADAISVRGEGGYTVSDSGTRETILKLREDPKLASLMAGALTQQNRTTLSAATGRDPNPGELYMAHLLGPRGAVDLIRAANDNPGRAVALDMPDAAAANRATFFDRGGRPRGAGELYAVLGGATNAASGEGRKAQGAPAAPALPQNTGPGLYGLFRNEGRIGPISDAVAKIWRVNNAPSVTKQAALSYFPRVTSAAVEPVESDATAISTAPAAPTAPEPGAPVVAASPPLPPARPRSERRADAPPSTTNAKRSGRGS